mmetsp:Transcript_16192/g.25074  ORF Transcript_16192/g.25074 Transcript_16192/m.25074 type:complete len:140 (+) Transcript_16192:2460-2879(+)
MYINFYLYLYKKDYLSQTKDESRDYLLVSTSGSKPVITGRALICIMQSPLCSNGLKSKLLSGTSPLAGSPAVEAMLGWAVANKEVGWGSQAGSLNSALRQAILSEQKEGGLLDGYMLIMTKEGKGPFFKFTKDASKAMK